jgi:hydrogenase expression/formation protein HypC
MCLAVPGQVLSIDESDPLLRLARVSFGGVVKQASLAYLPQAVVGDWVVVHAGVALHTLDEAEAQQVFEYLRQIDKLAAEDAGSVEQAKP